jgi:hypothetical protein
VLSSLYAWCRGQDAASEARYCRSTNVVRKFFGTMDTSKIKVKTPLTIMTERVRMKITFCTLTIAVMTILTSCDPVHDLRLENKTNRKIEVIYSPTLDQQELEGHEPIKVRVNGQEMNSITLEPTETIRIGDVTARYNPKATDVKLDYLEVRFGNDTLKLIGQEAILSTIQKVEKLDWRLIIRSE